jgi:hypothetical protein
MYLFWKKRLVSEMDSKNNHKITTSGKYFFLQPQKFLTKTWEEKVHACPTLRTRKSRRLAIGCGQSENESPLL